jgi:membrane-bound ClpP family serine protease
MSTPPPLPVPSAADPAPRSRRGVLALVLGIVALVLAFVPFASYGAWLVGIAAIVLGILALVRPASRKGPGIAGIVLGALAVIASLVMSIVYTVLFAIAATTAAASGYASQSAGAPVGGSGTAHRVVYAVTGSGRASAIAYYTVSGGQSGQTTLSDQPLPWSKTVTVRGTLTSASSVLTVVGQNAGSGTIACSITLDGKVVAEQSGDGKGSTAQCIYRPGS